MSFTVAEINNKNPLRRGNDKSLEKNPVVTTSPLTIFNASPANESYRAGNIETKKTPEQEVNRLMLLLNKQINSIFPPSDPKDYPSAIRVIVRNFAFFENKLKGFKEKIDEKAYEKIEKKLETSAQTVMAKLSHLIFELENNPEKLIALKKEFSDAAACDDKGIYAALKNFFDEKYPDDRINEIKEINELNTKMLATEPFGKVDNKGKQLTDVQEQYTVFLGKSNKERPSSDTNSAYGFQNRNNAQDKSLSFGQATSNQKRKKQTNFD